MQIYEYTAQHSESVQNTLAYIIIITIIIFSSYYIALFIIGEKTHIFFKVLWG